MLFQLKYYKILNKIKTNNKIKNKNRMIFNYIFFYFYFGFFNNNNYKENCILYKIYTRYNYNRHNHTKYDEFILLFISYSIFI